MMLILLLTLYHLEGDIGEWWVGFGCLGIGERVCYMCTVDDAKANNIGKSICT